MNTRLTKYILKLRGETDSKYTQTPFNELPKEIFEYKGLIKYRDVKSVNGYCFDILKSAMQKYGRRCMFNECLYSMIEMYLFKFLRTENTVAKSTFTNFKNRIKIIFLEDISIASPLSIPLIDEYIKQLDNPNISISKSLIKIAYHMCHTPHYRLYSHLSRYFYHNPPSPPKNNKETKIDLGTDSKTFGNLSTCFLTCLKEKSIETVYWMERIINHKEKLKVKRYRSNRPGFLVFHLFEGFYKGSNKIILNNFRVCLEWYKDLKVSESNICPFHVVYLYILEEYILLDSKRMQIKVENPLEYYTPNLTNIKISINDYVIDKHTRLGRNMGQNSTHFAVEGSLVGFEDKILSKLFDPQKRLYMGKHIRNVEAESEIFKAKTQLTCSIYSAKYKNKNVLVKGPYLTYNEINKIFQIHQILTLFEGVNNIHINLKVLYVDVSIGLRNKFKKGDIGYFVIFDDVFEYPISKLFEGEIVDFDKKDSKTLISFIYQLAILYVFKLGNFTHKNFILKNQSVFNINIENIFVGKKLKLEQVEKKLLLNIYNEYSNKIKNKLQRWLEGKAKWNIVKRTFNLDEKQLVQIQDNIRFILKDFEGWL